MRRRKRKYSERPVLYIDQPDFKVPSASMQSDYYTPTPKEEIENLPSSPSESEARLRKSKRKTKIVPETVNTLDEEEKEEEEKAQIDLKMDDENEITDRLESESEEDEGEEESMTQKVTVKKPFSDMTIEEQVDYLAAKPTNIPKLKCEIAANTARYRGIITAFEDGIIQIETFKRPKFHQVNVEDINSIRLLGF